MQEARTQIPEIIRKTRINDVYPYAGSVVINKAVCTSDAYDPVIKIFRTIRDNRYQDEGFSASIIPAKRTAIGWQYDIFVCNVEDGLTDLAEKFQDFLEKRFALDFEEMLNAFFEDPDGYAAYRTCAEEGEIEAANRVTKDFVYRTVSDEERKKIDRESKKKRKADERAKRIAIENRKALKALGIPASLLATMLL